MVVEITPTIVFGAIGASVTVGSALVGIGVFVGDSRYFKRSEGTILEKALVQLTESVKGFTDTKQGLARVHERLDDVTAKLERLIGSCGNGKC